jgi:transposase
MQKTDKTIYELVYVLLQKVEFLEKENALFRQENSELKSRLNGNSKNSSRPPSSDGYRKKPTPALPKIKKGKQGGQKGHKGDTLQQSKTPDKLVKIRPSECGCGHHFTDKECELSSKRQVFELPQPQLEVIEYQIHTAKCPKCGLMHQGEAPKNVTAPVQYGNRAKAFAVLLNTNYKVPFKKIQLMFKDLFGYSINESTIYSASKLCYDQLEKTEEVIKSKVSESNVVHADESGLRVLGKLHWLHTATTLNHTYLFVHEKRGQLALNSDKSILDKVAGWLVHDCWSSYFKFNGMDHAICGAHILRELQGLIESGESEWAKEFHAFLLDLYKQPFTNSLDQMEIIKSRYLEICNKGEKQEPPPYKPPGKRGRQKRTKGRNLVERLIREMDAVLAFAFNEEVPFTNNLAERDIRPVKVKMKVSNCFRTLKGAEIYARIESFISTARKNNCNIFEELTNTFDGYNFLVPDTTS